MATQLPLQLCFNQEQSFANYITGPNSTVAQALRGCAEGCGEPLVFLWSETGLGKSHLLNACCQLAQTLQRRSAYIPLTELRQHGSAVLENMEYLDLLCLDDIQTIAGDSVWELTLFHLFNRLRDSGKYMLISANTAPAQLPLVLPDLHSRLTWGLTLRLHDLTDEDKLAAVNQRSQQLGMSISPAVGKYLLAHYPRDLPGLWRLLDGLDSATLAAQRKLTIPFLKAYLEKSR